MSTTQFHQTIHAATSTSPWKRLAAVAAATAALGVIPADPHSDCSWRTREARIGVEDPNWPHWYAAYMVAEQAGTELPV